MAKNLYDEEKKKVSLTLTKTAVRWLRRRQAELDAISLSDVIERLARAEKDTKV